MNVFDRLSGCAVIPVIKIKAAADAAPLAAALTAGGITCAEVTFRTDAAADAITAMKSAQPDMCIGAGTVCDILTCQKALEAGAEFIVSPGCPPELAEYCLSTGAVFIPGVSTATELIAALSYGFTYVKFFPAEACGGLKALEALAAPFPSVHFMPTGGINPDNIARYLSSPRVFCVGASFIADSGLIEKADFDGIRKRAAAALHRPADDGAIIRRDITKGKIVAFGEIMLRLSPEGYTKTEDAGRFEACFGGAEANVAVSLSVLGERASYVTKLPDNPLGCAAKRALNRYGVDTSNIIIGGDRLGIYIYEKGFGSRGANVIYDRAGSAAASSQPSEYDWARIFSDAAWFHVTGITPALSDGARETCAEALRCAKSRGLTVSCDLNYRGKLWSEEKAASVMKPLMKYVDVFIGNEEHTAALLGIRREENEPLEAFFSRLTGEYGFSYAAITYRRTLSPTRNTFCAALYDGVSAVRSQLYDIEIAERVGGGDAFAAGLIYALMNRRTSAEAVNFAAAACAVKHSIPGDFSTASAAEIDRVARQSAQGLSFEVKR